MAENKFIFCSSTGCCIFVLGESLYSWGYSQSTLGYSVYDYEEDDEIYSDAEEYVTGYDGFKRECQTTPRIVPNTENIDVISVSPNTTCTYILDKSGNVWSCGLSSFDCLGLPGEWMTESPQMIPRFANIMKIYSGPSYGFFIDSDENVWGIGHNEFGQLGLGYTSTSIDTPTIIPSLHGKHNFVCCVGIVYCTDKDGQLYTISSNNGNPENYLPQAHPHFRNVIQYAKVGDFTDHKSKLLVFDKEHNLCLQTMERVNNNLLLSLIRLGGYSFAPKYTTVNFPSTNILAIVGCDSLFYILDDNGKVWSISQLLEICNISDQAKDLPSIVEINSVRTCIFMRDINGSIWALGTNRYGECCTGDFNTVSVPTKIHVDFEFPSTKIKSAKF